MIATIILIFVLGGEPYLVEFDRVADCQLAAKLTKGRCSLIEHYGGYKPTPHDSANNMQEFVYLERKYI